MAMNEYVVEIDDHFLMFTKYVNDLTLKEHVSHRPCATIHRATKFQTVQEASDCLSLDTRLDLTKCKIRTVQSVFDEAKEEADKNSDEIIKNAWPNTSRKKQDEMMENLRQAKGEEAVQDWLNKYGLLNEETKDE
jgi:hypothetical protein